jgi:hypothetical protein
LGKGVAVSVRAPPLALLVKILESFEGVMPAGSSMDLTDRVLNVQCANGAGWFGEPLGGLPWPPMPPRVKWRLAVRDVYETAARGLGCDRKPPRYEGDPFQLWWPVPDAQTYVEVTDQMIVAEFRERNGSTALAMPKIEWTGRRT